MIRFTLFLAVSLSLFCGLSSGQTGDAPQLPTLPGAMKDVAGIDAFLQGKAVPKTLGECQAYALQWQAWYKYNAPVHEQLQYDYLLLKARYHEVEAENGRLSGSATEIRLRIFIAFASVGAGLFFAFLISRGVRRAWPPSFEHKQLAVLILVASWVSVAALVTVTNSHFSYHPVSSAFTVGVWSLPALAFGAVAFWWFGKKHPMRLF